MSTWLTLSARVANPSPSASQCEKSLVWSFSRRRKEMKIEASMAEMRKARAEFVQRSSLSAQGHGDFHAFAKVEALQRGLSRKMGKSCAEVAHNTAEITSQRRDGNVVAYVECR